MPPLPVIADAFLVTQHLVPTQGRHEFVNRMCVFDTVGGQTPSTIATEVAGAHSGAFVPIMRPEIVYGVTDVLPLDGVSSTQTFTTSTAGTAGTSGGTACLPYSSAYVFSLQTGHRGRSKRGRMYIPGVSNIAPVSTESNVLASGTVTGLATAAAAFLGALDGSAPAHLALSVLSLKLGTRDAVIHIRGNSVLGVQRRRYEKVARH